MRYAIYFTPPEGDALTVRAANWLGRDAFQDRMIEQHSAGDFARDEIVELTAEPRRYGFHATLKAPFEMAGGTDVATLHAAFDEFAASLDTVTIPAVALGQLGAFFALVPAAWNAELQELADKCVRHFEPLRAPLDEKDIARRKPDSLTASQYRHLVTWGYPYVFEDFRFHMTLTGQVPAARQAAMLDLLSERFAEFIDQPLEISNLALFVEPERGAPFVLDRIQPLSARKRKIA